MTSTVGTAVQQLGRDWIWEIFSIQTSWTSRRTRSGVVQLDGSWRLAGIYDTGTQICHSREVTNGLSDAHLADVIDPDRRDRATAPLLGEEAGWAALPDMSPRNETAEGRW